MYVVYKSVRIEIVKVAGVICSSLLFSNTHSYILRYIVSVLRKNASKYRKLRSGIRTRALKRAGSAVLSARARTTAMIEIVYPFSKKELLAILAMQT